ncbi:MAG: 3-hydroxyacyl-CoA dehydrogenase, partial [Alphaproteobacteria bacterium]|nr:3-hydroxyacyl-CoA dehydrogenase [Alphaproteobacteria bacterium]
MSSSAEAGQAMRAIGKVAVIGAGVMGAGIAAQVANAGYPALLLDMTEELARTAREQLGRRTPQAFMHPSAERLVTARGLAEGLTELATCDWIIEAVIEDADVKRGLYRRIAPHMASHAALSSNTSTIRRADLAASLPDAIARRYLISHFFNPPRTMRLLEIVAGPDVAGGTLDAVIRFADRALGKTVVRCRDRPGFIANRLGCFWMQTAIALACEQGLSVEEADAVMGEPFGVPKTGVFGLADLVGIDLMPKVNGSLAAALEKDDLFQTVNRPVPEVERMVDAGLTGRKAGGGFYRLQQGVGQGKEAIDLVRLTYRPFAPVKLRESTELFGATDRLGSYGTAVMARTLAYAGHLVGDAAEDAAAIDEAMRLGYNWRWGPFELADRIGLDRLKTEITAAGLALPPFMERAGRGPIHCGAVTLQRDGTYAKRLLPAGILSLADIKANARAVFDNSPLQLWPLGEGIFCLEFAAPHGLMDVEVLDGLAKALDHVEGHGRALVIYSDGDHFLTGAEMANLANLIREGNWSVLTSLIAKAQAVLDRLKRAPFPTVAALSG